MAPPDTNTANISQHTAIELTPPAHIPTPSSNGYNECLNLITQTLQNTIQALTQLVQQINYLNVQNLTPPPAINKKNRGFSPCLFDRKAFLPSLLAERSPPSGEEVRVVVDPIAGLAINHRCDNPYESDRLKFPTRRLTLSKPSDFVSNIQGHYNFLLPHQGLRYVFDMGRRIS
ncbi:hypothetical protein TNCV_64181 [Trichonephila clavipes]|nr:hypothetical protein TNCV_64181 [Trichonephila clavipes]